MLCTALTQPGGLPKGLPPRPEVAEGPTLCSRHLGSGRHWMAISQESRTLPPLPCTHPRKAPRHMGSRPRGGPSACRGRGARPSEPSSKPRARGPMGPSDLTDRRTFENKVIQHLAGPPRAATTWAFCTGAWGQSRRPRGGAGLWSSGKQAARHGVFPASENQLPGIRWEAV